MSRIVHLAGFMKNGNPFEEDTPAAAMQQALASHDSDEWTMVDDAIEESEHVA